jgi:hypothetical protein
MAGLPQSTVNRYTNVIGRRGRVLPDAVDIRRLQYSSSTVGGRASKAASQERSDNFISRPANPC